jgi:hypothetical protein
LPGEAAGPGAEAGFLGIEFFEDAVGEGLVAIAPFVSVLGWALDGEFVVLVGDFYGELAVVTEGDWGEVGYSETVVFAIVMDEALAADQDVVGGVAAEAEGGLGAGLSEFLDEEGLEGAIFEGVLADEFDIFGFEVL